MRIALASALVAVALAMSAPTLAGPFEDADAAAHRKDYAAALRLWRALAEQGDAYAQFNIGLMHFNGHGVPQDYAEALRLWRPIAARGDPLAQYSVGFLYDNGYGVPEDVDEALSWYRMAAEQGDDVADGLREMAAARMTPEQVAEAEQSHQRNLVARRKP